MEEKIKHLEFIQNIIARLGNNTFILKGWSISVCAALIAFSEKLSFNIAFFSLSTLLIFWALDGFYLSLERKYRGLYDVVRKLTQTDFDLDISKFKGKKYNIFSSIFSMGLMLFHGGLIILFCIYLLIKCR